MSLNTYNTFSKQLIVIEHNTTTFCYMMLKYGAEPNIGTQQLYHSLLCGTGTKWVFLI